MESQVYVRHSARHYFCLLLSACRKLYSEYSLKELRASLKQPGLVAGDQKECWNTDGWSLVSAPGSKISPRVEGTELS